MKKRGLVLTSLSLLIGALAVTGATSLAAFESSKREIKIVGTNGMHGSTIFLSAGVWEDDVEASFHLFSWADGKETIWLSPIGKATENGYYIFELDTNNYTNIIFARMDPAHNAKTDFDQNTDYLWNKTADLTFDPSKRLYKITGWGTYGQKVSVGEWAVYNDN